MTGNKYIIDFDSTFIKVETLDVLGAISLEKHPEKAARLQNISDITNSGMNGDISFRETLVKRIEWLDASQSHLEELICQLKELVSTSFTQNRDFLITNADNIYIVSSGFKEFITPVVADYGIAANHVYANTFEFDTSGKIIDFDRSNPLSGEQGKVKVMETLGLEGPIAVIGDGFTDYEIKQYGKADTFFAFVENVSRDKVTKVADHVVNDFNEILAITE